MLYESDNIPYASMLQAAISRMAQNRSEDSQRRDKATQDIKDLIGVGGKAFDYYSRSKDMSTDTDSIRAEIAELKNKLNDLAVEKRQLELMEA